MLNKKAAGRRGRQAQARTRTDCAFKLLFCFPFLPLCCTGAGRGVPPAAELLLISAQVGFSCRRFRCRGLAAGPGCRGWDARSGCKGSGCNSGCRAWVKGVGCRGLTAGVRLQGPGSDKHAAMFGLACNPLEQCCLAGRASGRRAVQAGASGHIRAQNPPTLLICLICVRAAASTNAAVALGHSQAGYLRSIPLPSLHLHPTCAPPWRIWLVQWGTASQRCNPFPSCSPLSSPLFPHPPYLRMCSIQSRVRLVRRGTADQTCHPLPLPTPSLSFTHIPFPHFHTCACAAFSGVCGWCSGGCETGWRQYARRRGSWWEGGCHQTAVTTQCNLCSCLSQSCTQVRRGGWRGGAGCGGLGRRAADRGGERRIGAGSRR